MDRLLPTPTIDSRRRWLRWGMLLVVGLGLLTAGLWRWTRADAAAADAENWLSVETSKIQLSANASGTLFSTAQRTLAAMESGRVQALHFRSGDRVAEGDVIASLVNPQLLADQETAETEWRRAEALLLDQQQQLDNEVEQAVLARDAAHLKLAVARTERDANQALVEKGIVSRLRFAQVEAAFAEAGNVLAQSEQRLRSLRARLTRRLHLVGEDARLARLKKERLAARLAALQVRADTPGMLRQLTVAMGDSLLAGARVAVLGPETPDGARLRVLPADLAAVQRDATASISVGNRRLPARVHRIEADIREGYGSVELRLSEAAPTDVRIDQPVHAQIDLGTAPTAAWVKTPLLPPADHRPLPVWRKRDGQISRIDLTAARNIGGVLFLDERFAAGDAIAFSPNQGE